MPETNVEMFLMPLTHVEMRVIPATHFEMCLMAATHVEMCLMSAICGYVSHACNTRKVCLIPVRLVDMYPGHHHLWRCVSCLQHMCICFFLCL